MQVGVQVIGQLAVELHALAVLGTQNELLVEAVALCRLVVGVCYVVDGDRLGSVLLAYPVGIWQVDAYGGCGVAVAAQHGYRHHLGRDALYLLLAEGGVDGRVVLEPLRIVGYDLRAVACGAVDKVHQTLP